MLLYCGYLTVTTNPSDKLYSHIQGPPTEVIRQSSFPAHSSYMTQVNISVNYLNSGDTEKRQEFFNVFTKEAKKRITEGGKGKVFRGFMRKAENPFNTFKSDWATHLRRNDSKHICCGLKEGGKATLLVFSISY